MNPLEGIQAVSFDVGGTLIDPWPSVGHVYAAAAQEMGLPSFDPAWLNGRFATAWRNRTDFNYSREAWASVVVNTFGGSVDDFGLNTRFFQRLYETFTEPRVWRVYEDVHPTLSALRQHGLALAVISNWDDRLRPLLRNLRLDAFFQVIEVSVESGFHKPDPEIFRRAVRALRLPARAILHAGDSIREDFEGAQAAGLGAILLNRTALSPSAHEIFSLAALTEGIR